MKVATPTLLPLLRSQTQGDIIAHVMLDPERDHSASEIAARLGVSLATVTREVARLVDAGLLAGTKRGNTRLLRVQTDNPVYRPLADLMAVTFGPVPVLRKLLTDVPGVEAAFVYGSWAARHAGVPGPVPGDIDLLVIGSPDRLLLDSAVEEAERTLRREVNTRRLTKAAWDADEGSFKSTVSARPMVEVVNNREDPR
jgi:DNA-binding transcriptional ArsR family regulator